MHYMYMKNSTIVMVKMEYLPEIIIPPWGKNVIFVTSVSFYKVGENDFQHGEISK